ncbi:GrpB family protein [Vibrio parahaemolyticus]
MKFYSAEEYQLNCHERFAYYKKEIQKLLPTARVEHVGASSVPNAISKGDLDIFIGVDARHFESAVRTLLTLGFREKQDTLRTHELCMLESLTEDVAFQVVTNNSEFEFFLVFRDKLRKNPALVEQYNNLKKSCEGCSQEDYRAKKSKFVEYVLAQP